MSGLKVYLEELLNKYGDAAEIFPAEEGTDPGDVPQPLAEFYSLFNRVRLPFGHIDPAAESSAESASAEPFRSERAFCFGGDNDGFRFWLCSLDGPDEDGCLFTSWDHDTDDGIEYAFGSLTELLKYAEREYLESLS